MQSERPGGNARPLLNFTYEATNVTSLERAVRLIYAGKAEVVTGRGSLRTVSLAMRLPSIIRMDEIGIGERVR